MVTNLHVQQAIEIAVKYHSNQVDKSGDLYILHPLRVMNHMDTADERVIAVLHDILEDTIVTEDYLLSLFPADIVEDIKGLSKRDNETYREFILRIREKPRQRKIKKADINDNISWTRVVKLEPMQAARLMDKYVKAWSLLMEAE